MNVKIQSLHFNADQKLIDFINERMNKLGGMYDKITGAEVILRLEKSSDTENKVGEIKLLVPGSELFAKRQCKTFEEAIDQSYDAVVSQLKRHKEKLRGV